MKFTAPVEDAMDSLVSYMISTDMTERVSEDEWKPSWEMIIEAIGYLQGDLVTIAKVAAKMKGIPAEQMHKTLIDNREEAVRTWSGDTDVEAMINRLFSITTYKTCGRNYQ